MAKTPKEYAEERRKQGKCGSCGEMAEPGKTRCARCSKKQRDKYQAGQANKDLDHLFDIVPDVDKKQSRKDLDAARYEAKKSTGLCARCGERPPVDTYTMCQECLDGQAVNRAKRKVTADAAKTVAKAATVAARTIAGLCVDCEGPPAPATINQRCRLCESRRLVREEGMTRHAARKLIGVCQKCVREVEPGTILCAIHQQGRVDGRATKRENNICNECPEPAVPGKRYCAKHGEENRQTRRDHVAACRLTGMCPDCPHDKQSPSATGKPPGTPCVEHLKYNREKDRRKCQKLRAEVLAAYGGKCSCPGCTITEPAFLEVDHIYNDGADHRREICGGNSRSGIRFYTWLRKHGFPKDRFQLLCRNCNGAKYQCGECPHVTAARAAGTLPSLPAADPVIEAEFAKFCADPSAVDDDLDHLFDID